MPPMRNPDFNPRVLTGFDKWVYETLKQIFAKLESIEQQMPDPREIRDLQDRG